jgi:hypothetical protein
MLNNMSQEGTNITEDENKEIINVSWSVYLNLIFKDKNWIVYLFVIPLFAAYAYCAVYTTYHFGQWVRHSQDETQFWELFTLSAVHPLGMAGAI